MFDDPTDVTYVYDFGYAPDPGEVAGTTGRSSGAFEAGPVEARYALHESIGEPGVMGERLTVTAGRGTPEGDAWIDAVIQSMVRSNEPELPESQIVDLAADLAASTGMYYEEVWSTVFVSGQARQPHLRGRDRHEPRLRRVRSRRPPMPTSRSARVRPSSFPTPENPFYREPFKTMQAAEFSALLEARRAARRRCRRSFDRAVGRRPRCSGGRCSTTPPTAGCTSASSA